MITLLSTLTSISSLPVPSLLLEDIFIFTLTFPYYQLSDIQLSVGSSILSHPPQLLKVPSIHLSSSSSCPSNQIDPISTAFSFSQSFWYQKRHHTFLTSCSTALLQIPYTLISLLFSVRYLGHWASSYVTTFSLALTLIFRTPFYYRVITTFIITTNTPRQLL